MTESLSYNKFPLHYISGMLVGMIVPIPYRRPPPPPAVTTAGGWVPPSLLATGPK